MSPATVYLRNRKFRWFNQFLRNYDCRNIMDCLRQATAEFGSTCEVLAIEWKHDVVITDEGRVCNNPCWTGLLPYLEQRREQRARILRAINGKD